MREWDFHWVCILATAGSPTANEIKIIILKSYL